MDAVSELHEMPRVQGSFQRQDRPTRSASAESDASYLRVHHHGVSRPNCRLRPISFVLQANGDAVARDKCSAAAAAKIQRTKHADASQKLALGALKLFRRHEAGQRAEALRAAFLRNAKTLDKVWRLRRHEELSGNGEAVKIVKDRLGIDALYQGFAVRASTAVNGRETLAKRSDGYGQALTCSHRHAALQRNSKITCPGSTGSLKAGRKTQARLRLHHGSPGHDCKSHPRAFT